MCERTPHQDIGWAVARYSLPRLRITKQQEDKEGKEKRANCVHSIIQNTVGLEFII